MNIALYHPWLKSRGGAEKVLLEYAERSDHDVTVFTLFYDREATFDGFNDCDVEVIGSNKPPKDLLHKALRFGIGSVTTKLPLDDYDALVVSEAGLGSLIALRNHDIPVVCYCHTPLRAALPEFRGTYRADHETWKRPLLRTMLPVYNALEKRAWKRFDHVICNSETTRQRVLAKGLTDEEKTSVIHPGVDINAFEQADFDHYFFYPSRFRRYKRQDLAIKAFNEVKDELEDFRLVLAGSAQEQDYIDELQAMDTERVEFRFDVSDADWRNLYANAYAVLFLAENEDWGITPLEAMACGKPVIAVDEGGPQESVVDGETGFLVDEKPERVADKMIELATNSELTQELGRNGGRRVKQYSWEEFSRSLDQQVRQA